MEKFVGKNKDWFDELLIIKAFEALYGSAYLHQQKSQCNYLINVFIFMFSCVY